MLSLDALRGFDMFWIIGGEELLRAVANLTGSETFRTIAYRNTEHPEWNGFSFYDLIFPLFMFIAGVAVPFSFASHSRTARELGPAASADHSPRHSAGSAGPRHQRHSAFRFHAALGPECRTAIGSS